MDKPAKAQFDVDIAPPEEKEDRIGRMNMESMAGLPGGLAPPPPGALKKRKKRADS